MSGRVWRVWCVATLATALGAAATMVLYVLVVGPGAGLLARGPWAGLTRALTAVVALAGLALSVGALQRPVRAAYGVPAAPWLAAALVAWAAAVAGGIVLALLGAAGVIPVPVYDLHGLTPRDYLMGRLRPAPPAQIGYVTWAGALAGALVGAGQALALPRRLRVALRGMVASA
jgi:hypothetical protein